MAEDCKCIKSETISILQENDKEILSLLHGKNPPPGILQTLNELATCVPEFKDQLKMLTDEKTGRDAIEKNMWVKLQKVSIYFAIFFGITTFYYASKEKPITIEQVQTVVSKSLLKYNITDNEIILRGRTIKPEGMTKEKLQKEVKEINQ
jgi:hypothetical protein